ncbi:MAG TPA: ABC transporter substrate-binding protein [Streptosporangiaceae bacterium]|jgi:peptide/nickel transport system substrate-binding protein|nr:ABC transporter substrate-binding protein [Streptosporangiaceae bacterium]
MRRHKLLVAVAAAGVLAAACSSTPAPSSTGGTNSSGPSGVLTIDNESGGTWTCDFNPFNLNYISFALGPVYEPLAFVNTLQSGKATPWLASGWTWSNGNKTLTFTIRNGVKFSNGDPLTAADVAFTFNMLHKPANSAMDINSIWSVLTSVTQSGSNQVVMQFKSAAVPYFYYVADQVGIVDQKIWSKIADPATYPDKNPVGTGAFTTGSSDCTPQNIKYVANKSYWQPGKPKVAVVNYPSFLTNDTANTFLASGQAQWGSQFIPSIQSFYVDKSPDNHYWFPPVVNVSLFINLKNPILSNVAVRQAMAYAVNRPRASTIGEYGYEPPSNQTGIVTPTFSSWLDTSQAAAFGNNYAYNPQKAISILKAAGFVRGSDGIFQTKSGQPLAFNLVDNGGFSDWVAAVQTIQADLAQVGIKITPENLAQTTYDNDIYNGQFDLGYYAETGGPSPYYELRQWLYSANSAPIGKPAGSNFERYDNPATDALLNEYGTTTSPTQQASIVDQLEKVMLTDVPLIPVTEEVDWFQYNTGTFTGWPTPSNPYAQPAAYNYPDWGQLMLNLAPVK